MEKYAELHAGAALLCHLPATPSNHAAATAGPDLVVAERVHQDGLTREVRDSTGAVRKDRASFHSA